MDLSIIIVNWNVRDFLERCLESIYRNVRGLTCEVIVVDNASRDDSVGMVREQFPQARLIANKENVGFCRGNNQGLEIARGDFFVLLNPDTEVYEGAMETMVGFLREHADVGVVGPMLVSPDGHFAPNGTRFPTLRRELLETTGLRGLLRQEHLQACYGRDDFTQQAEVDVLCGACLMTRREVVETTGGLDEGFFMFYEETDFCRRARQDGWRAFYLPQARVYHHWMQSVRQDNITATRRLYRSQFRYFRKHHGLSAALLLRVLSAGTVASRAARIYVVRLRDRLRRRAA